MQTSFQAYLDNIEQKTGLTHAASSNSPRSGFDDPAVKAGEILDWLTSDHGLGRGHGMALGHVIKKGPRLDAKHADSEGPHRDESDLLWLDGVATKPEPAGSWHASRSLRTPRSRSPAAPASVA